MRRWLVEGVRGSWDAEGFLCDGWSLGEGVSGEWVRAHKKAGTGGETLIPVIEPKEVNGKSGG